MIDTTKETILYTKEIKSRFSKPRTFTITNKRVITHSGISYSLSNINSVHAEVDRRTMDSYKYILGSLLMPVFVYNVAPINTTKDILLLIFATLMCIIFAGLVFYFSKPTYWLCISMGGINERGYEHKDKKLIMELASEVSNALAHQ